jgi:hypothetical protein
MYVVKDIISVTYRLIFRFRVLLLRGREICPFPSLSKTVRPHGARLLQI